MKRLSNLPNAKEETNTASVREWHLPMAEKSLPVEGQKVEKRFLYPLSLVTKNDDKKTIFKVLFFIE